jgi:hypothetical protein
MNIATNKLVKALGLALACAVSIQAKEVAISDISFERINTDKAKNIVVYRVHNQNNNILENVKLTNALNCNGTTLYAGEAIECNFKDTSKITSKLTANSYKSKINKTLNIFNGSFESGSFDNWQVEGNCEVEAEEYLNKNGEFITIIGTQSGNLSSEVSKIINIENGKIYKADILATLNKPTSMSKAYVRVIYLNDKKEPIIGYEALKYINNNGKKLQNYSLILKEAPKNAKYIKFIAYNGDGELVIDNLKVFQITKIPYAKGYKNLIDLSATAFKSSMNSLGGMGALCNTCDAQVGDHVWKDCNKNGKYDSGERGISGVKVYAIKDGKVVASTTTNSSGYYKFYKLCKGNYKFKFIAPSGYTFTKYIKGFAPEHNSAHSNGYTDTLYVYAAYRFNNVDVGLYKCNSTCNAELGDWVWNDANKNGLQDSGEKGIAGVKIKLYKDGKYLKSTITNSNGYYKFTGLCAGKDYKIKVEIPSGWQRTKYRYGYPRYAEKDSNIKTDDGWSGDIQLDNGNKTMCFDFGMYKKFIAKPKIDIEKYTNNQDADTGTGPVVAVGSTVTWKYVVKNNGNVKLCNVKVTDNKIGTICSGFSLEPGESKTCTKTGKAIAGQYSNIGTVEACDKYNHKVKDSDPSHYFGKNPNTASIGDYVWYDKDVDGVQESGAKFTKHPLKRRVVAMVDDEDKRFTVV